MPYYVALPNGSYVEMPDDIPQDQAMQKISLDPRFRPIIEQSFEKEKNLLRDIPGYLVRGVGQVPTAVGSLINVVPGMEQNIVGRGLRSAGESISGAGTGILSPGTQRQQALFDLAMQEAENQGLTDQAKTALAEAIRNPRIAAGIAIESLPSLVGSFGAGLATRAAAGVASRVAGRQLTEQAARRAAIAGAVGSESLLEGGGSADEVYRSIMALPEEQLQRSPEYQDLLKQGLKPDEAKERLAVSAARQAAAQTAAISGTVGAVIPGAESAMFRPLTQRGVVGRALGVAAPELVQEAGQEGGAALSENIARQRAEVDRELLAGVGSRATMGAIVGGLTGAGVGAARRGPGPEIDRTEDAELRNILNEYVNVRGEAPAVPPTVSERDAEAAAFVAANLPISEEMFLAMPPAGRARVMAIARNRADRAAAQQQEQGFRQEAETRAAEQAEQARVQEIAGRQARAQEETAALTAAGREATTPRVSVTPQEELSQAVQESRAATPLVGEPITARYIEARAMEAPNQPISLPAFQQYLKGILGRPATLQEARDSLEGYFKSTSDMRVKPRFTLEKEGGAKSEEEKTGKYTGRYIARDSDYRGEGVQVKRAPPSKRLGESIATGETKSPFGEPGIAPESPAFALPPDVKEILRDLRRGVKLQQQSLVNFLKSVGGLNNTGYMAGEVFDILGSYTARPGLINNQPRTIIKDQYGRPAGYRGGLSLDAAREKLVEEGYLPEDATINDMLNAIREELSGGAVNYGITEDYEGQERQRAARQLEQALDEAGVSANDSDEDIAIALGLEFPTKPRTLEDIEAESQARFAGVPPKELGPAEEYSRRKPRGPIGSTAPMQVSIPERFAGETAPAATAEEQATQQEAADKAQANEARRIEILQKLNDEYLAKLEAKGPQGKRAADAVRKSLEDRTLTAEQLYGAFKGAEIITDTLPAKADHEIEFVKHVTDASGQEVQGKRMEVKDSSAAGIIKLSLSESQLPLLGETSSHEAFHVLQDYYGKYDADFRRLMKQSFRDGMTINDVDSTIKRKLQTIRMPNGEQSYWDALVQSLPDQKLSAREAEAYVFGSLAEAARRGVPMTGMKPAFTRFVNFLTKFFRRMKSAIRGDGFNSPDDVLGRVVEGDAARFAGETAPEFRGSESSARLPPGSATYQAAAQKINGDRLKQNSVLKRGIDALVGARAEYTYVYSGKKEAVKPKTNLAINVANQFHGFHLFDQLMERKGRMDMAGVGRALESAMNNDGRIQTMIEGGGIGLNPATKMVERNKNVKPLADIFFGRVKADEQDAAQRYLVARRERDERARGRIGFANLTDKEIDEVIRYSETNRPQWKDMAKDYDDFNKGLIKILVDSGVIDKKVGDELSSVFYTPFYRVLEDDFKAGADSVIGPKAAASLKNPSDALKKLSGEGTDPVGDLFENIIRNADGIVKAALKNVAMQKAVKSMEFAGIAEKVNTKLPGAQNIVTIRDNGKDVFYRVDDPLLMTALATMPQSSQHGILKAMAKVGGFTRDMITHTPAFTIASLIRGKEMSYGQEGISLARSTILAFGRTLKANFIDSERRKGDIPISRIRDITGFGGMSFGMGSPDVAAEFKRMLRRASKQETVFDSTKRLLGWYAMKRVGEAAEMAERVKVYEHFKSKGASDEDAAWEAYAMAPFSRRGAGNGFLGALITGLAPIVPFLNARVQGNFRLLEKGIHNPFGMRIIDRKLGPDKTARAMWLRGMVLMAFSMAMAMVASDDERWDDENPETKFMYNIAYLGSEPDSPKILIPRGFELGTLFGAIPVFMYDAIRKDGGNDLGKLFGLTLQSTFGINPPAALAPVLEVVTNYDFFRGRELESAGMQSRPKSERFTSETSEAAKVIADAVNSSLGNLPRGMRVEMSPLQAQHLIRGYLGGVGVWSMQVVDTVLGASGAVPQKPDGFFGDPSSPAAIAAVALQANRFIRGKEDMVSRAVGEFYDIKREVTQWTTALNDAQIQNNIERAKEIQEERKSTLAMRRAVNDAGPAISELSRMIEALRKSSELGDPEDRRRRILELIRQRNQIAERVVEIAREQGVR